MLQRFFQEEEGQSLVEYSLLIAFIALIAISAVTLFGTRIKTALYDKAVTQLPN